MSRRTILAAVELTAVTTTLAASLPILAHAVNYGTDWAGPAMAGTLVATAILVPVAPSLLLLAICQRRQHLREQADVPPSARLPLWPTPAAEEMQAWERNHPQPDPAAYVAARRARYGADAAGRHAGPDMLAAAREASAVAALPPTVPMPVEELAAAGGKPVGHG